MKMEKRKNIELSGKYGKAIYTDFYYKLDNTPKAVVVFCHGFKGFKDWGAFDRIAEAFALAGLGFVKFNFSHNGVKASNFTEITDEETFGENNFTIELSDLDTVINWIEKSREIPSEEIDTSKIYLMGHSRGGGISIIKAGSDSRIKKLVTWGTVNDFALGWDQDLEKWKEEGVRHVINKRTGQKLPLNYQIAADFIANKDKYDIKKAVSELNIPFLAVHGIEDEAVLYEQSVDLKRLNNQVELELIPHGTHTFGIRHPFEEDDLPFEAKLAVEKSIDFFLRD